MHYREIYLKDGESCPDGYRKYSFLGDPHMRCRAPYRYGLMPLHTPEDERWSHPGMDYDRITEGVKRQANEATWRASESGHGPWGIYDRTKKRFVYTGDLIADLRHRIERQEQHVRGDTCWEVNDRATTTLTPCFASSTRMSRSLSETKKSHDG
jgi:hypothetical protein